MTRTSTRAAFMSAVGSGLAATAIPRAARAQSNVVRAAGSNVADLFAGPFYAQASGAFAKVGLDLQPTAQTNGAASIAAITGGSMDLAVADMIAGANAIIAGVPIAIIAAGALYRTPQDRPSALLAVGANSPINDPKELAGKVIGVPTLVGLTTACLRAWLPAHGVQDSQVKLVELPPVQAVAALQRGTIDAGLLSEPFVTPFRSQIRAIGYPYDVVAEQTPHKQFCISVWYASKAFLQADKARAKKVVTALYDTARWANTHPKETLDILIGSGKLDASKVAGMTRVQFATALTPDLIQPVLTLGEKFKLLSKPVTAADLIATI